MKILFLCTFYHTAALYAQQKRGLEKRGHVVSVFNSAKIGSGVAEKFRALVAAPGVVHKECWNEADRLLFFPRQRKIQRQLEKAFPLAEYDLLHAHLLLSSGFTARRIKEKYGLPYVVSLRQTDLTGFIKIPFFQKMALKNALEAKGILFLSKGHKKEFFEKYVPQSRRAELDAKSVIIGNPLEPFWEKNTAKTPRAAPGGKTVNVLYVGTIDRNKNVPTTAKAVQILIDKGYTASFTVVGGIKDQTEADRLGQYAFVKLIPFMKAEELLPVYRSCDVFVMPSFHETFGRVYVEAMSQGLPVLYSKGQGFDEVYPDGEVGYSVPSDDPEAIAQRIEDVLRNYGQISANCIRNASDFYEDHIIDEIETFYRSLISSD